MLPDYNKSILSVTSSVAQFFGAKTPYPPLREVTNALYEKDTKCVVLLLFDGMGENLLKRHLPVMSAQLSMEYVFQDLLLEVYRLR